VASYQSAWAPVQPEAPQRPAGIAPSAVLGLAAMAAVGATGAIGLATPARAATISDAMSTAAKPSLSVQDHLTGELSAGATALGERTTGADPGNALADRIRAQAAQQRADADDAARRQAAQTAAARLAAKADAEEQARAEAAQQAAEAAAQAEAREAHARAEAAELAAQAEQDARAAAEQVGTLVTPVQGAVVGAGFGQSGTYWAQLHTGLDLSAPTGAPVVAIGAGTVTSAGWAGSYGYRVVETLPDGTELWYCHLSAIGVGAGEVTPGQPIGRVGATGNVSGPHLYLEVRPGGGEPVDPAQWLAERGLSL
jgi:murein DD-endopeptidase MepM/ murein hydrolase activator NlpD